MPTTFSITLLATVHGTTDIDVRVVNIQHADPIRGDGGILIGAPWGDVQGDSSNTPHTYDPDDQEPAPHVPTPDPRRGAR